MHDLYRTQGLAPCVAFEGPSYAHRAAGRQHQLAADLLNVLSIILSAETLEVPIVPRYCPTRQGQ